jgi:hypothetical protein
MQLHYQKERALGYQQITTLTAATGLTVPAGTNLILVTAEGGAVRWRDDGTNPTASVGYPLPVGAEMRYTADSPSRLKFIDQATGAILNITYYG